MYSVKEAIQAEATIKLITYNLLLTTHFLSHT